MLQAQHDGIPRHGPIMYAVKTLTVFREGRGLKRFDVSVQTHGRVYAAICFRTLTTHFHWVENCTSTVLIKVWPVITVEVVCFKTLQIRSTYFDFFECTYGHLNTEWYPCVSIIWPAYISFNRSRTMAVLCRIWWTRHCLCLRHILQHNLLCYPGQWLCEAERVGGNRNHHTNEMFYTAKT